MKGWILTIITDENLFMLEFFKLFKIGFASINDESGYAKALILGIWRLETNITFVLRKKLEWQDYGQA